MTGGSPKKTDVTAEAVRSGSRAALARAITLMESRRPDHREAARALLQALMPSTGKAVRVGITGIPGVGKSTLLLQVAASAALAFLTMALTEPKQLFAPIRIDTGQPIG